jgi:hypothetical protein
LRYAGRRRRRRRRRRREQLLPFVRWVVEALVW